MFRFKSTIVCFLVLVIGVSVADAVEPLDGAVGALLTSYCVDCHGEHEQNDGIRLDRLSGFDAENQHLWGQIYEAVSLGQMPPEGSDNPSQSEKKQLLDWLVLQSTRIQSGRLSQRRLNRRETSAALQDLIALPIDFASSLADDGKVDGLDTGAIGLQDTADSVTQLLEISRRAVDSIRILEPSTEQTIEVDFREHDFNDFRKFVEQNWKDSGLSTKSKRLICKEDLGLFLPTQWTGDRGSSLLSLPAPQDRRATLVLTLRVKAVRPMTGLPQPMLWVKVGGKYIDYQSIDESGKTLTYAVRMEDSVVEDGVIKVMLRCFVEMPYAVDGFENDDRSKPEDKIPGGVGVFRPRYDKKKLRTPDVQPVPSIVIETLQIDYDHRRSWPPESWGVKPGKLEDNDAVARRLLAIWIERAWRRPASDIEQEKFFALYRRLRSEGMSLDVALRGVFQAVLLGGPFRYLASPEDPDAQTASFAKASRLSFMLWGTPPDQELLRFAALGKLDDARVLETQIDRLLADERADGFFEPFVFQWLNLDQPITQVMSHFKKQDFKFGRHLKDSMKQETVQYVKRLFTENRPAAELIQSDWTMMNDVLSWFYKVDRIDGDEMQPVRWPKDHPDPRGGGLLSHGGIQSMLCWMGDNWIIYRGAWTLQHLLDDPPAPPPLEVPELNPSEHQGKSIREILAEHQANPNCSICHHTMDPLGFAFQNFDLAGRWRDVEHASYDRSELDGKIQWRGKGAERAVDAKGSLPRGETFESYQQVKNLIVKNYQDDLVRGLLKKLTLYGTGRQVTIVDRVTIERILDEHRKHGFRLRDLLKSLVKSEVFAH